MGEGAEQGLEDLWYLQGAKKEQGEHSYLSHFYSKSAVLWKNVQRHKENNLK